VDTASDVPPAGLVEALALLAELRGVAEAEQSRRRGGATTWTEFIAASLPQ